MTKPGITLLGLGTGGVDLLTRQAWLVLEQSREVWARVSDHPALSACPAQAVIHSFAPLVQAQPAETLDHGEIVEKIISLGARPQGVIYAVPGHPLIDDAAAPEIIRRAELAGLPVQVVEGISYLGSALSAIRQSPSPSTSVVTAQELTQSHIPPFPPGSPALVIQLGSNQVASAVAHTLGSLYPAGHQVYLVHAPTASQQRVEKLLLSEIGNSLEIGEFSALYLPGLDPASSFEALQEVVAHLRAPDGCPWDREQDYRSLRPYLLEETYELLAALDEGNISGMREELGDLLLQVIMYAQIAAENRDFTMSDVLAYINTKLVYRHPHVFGDVKLDGVDGVLQNWEKLKAQERKQNGKTGSSMLDGIPLALPALVQAEQYVKRAARVGFDWPEIGRVLAKVDEELAEVRQATTTEERTLEIGDLFFAVVNLARWYKVDPESALREASARFRTRFAHVESAASTQGRPLSEMSLLELETLWQAAKVNRPA